MLNCRFHYSNSTFHLDVDLHWRTKMLGILGDSGSGKTTFLKSLAGIYRPQAGTIIFREKTYFDHEQEIFIPAYQRYVALVFQQSLLFPHMNVRQNLLYGYRRIKHRTTKFDFAQIVQLLKLEPLLTRRAHQLSGGESQRVCLGRALLSSPDLLLLDEPLTGLDVHLKTQFLDFLNQIQKELSLPMIYVTHQHEELSYLQAPIAYMQKGHLSYRDE